MRGLYGQRDYTTPNIDSLAIEGLRFNAQSRMSHRTFVQTTAGFRCAGGLGLGEPGASSETEHSRAAMDAVACLNNGRANMRRTL